MEADVPGRRQSNDGYRTVGLEERVLMFLTRLRRKTPFEEMGFQYGCGETSARRYFDELVNCFVEHVVPRLVFPRSPEELKKMARKEVLEAFSDLLYTLHATTWEQQKPENFCLNRLSYSAYKHYTVFQTLMGTYRVCALILC